MSVLLIVLLAVLSIIPALIVAVILWLRNEAIRGDILTCTLRTETSSREVNHLLSEYQSLKMAIQDAEISSHSVKQKMVSIEESFVNLNNKWVSRERAEKATMKREEKEKAREIEVDEIPGTEQQGMFTFPQPADVQASPAVRRRKFGEPI